MSKRPTTATKLIDQTLRLVGNFARDNAKSAQRALEGAEKRGAPPEVTAYLRGRITAYESVMAVCAKKSDSNPNPFAGLAAGVTALLGVTTERHNIATLCGYCGKPINDPGTLVSAGESTATSVLCHYCDSTD